MSEANAEPASEKAAAIETVINGFLTYSGFSDQDRQGRIVWLSVLQDGARDWKFEDWVALEVAVKRQLNEHPSYSLIMGVVSSKLIVLAAAEETTDAPA
ncbi:MAG: hypothetical protein QMC36_00335 [Patescibacteria group bacterium]